MPQDTIEEIKFLTTKIRQTPVHQSIPEHTYSYRSVVQTDKQSQNDFNYCQDVCFKRSCDTELLM